MDLRQTAEPGEGAQMRFDPPTRDQIIGLRRLIGEQRGRRVTQAVMADELRIEHVTTYARYEQGVHPMPPGLWRLMCSLAGVPESWAPGGGR